MWNIVAKLFKSKTLIVNWTALVAATLTLWLDSSLIQSNPEVVAVLTSVLAAVNIVLRAVTSLPLSEK
jgi:hypothetical protein